MGAYLDYFRAFFSGSAAQLYFATIEMFKGGKWVETPLTDPKTGKHLGDWWAQQYKALDKYVVGNPSLTALRDTIVEKLNLLHGPPVANMSKADIGEVAIRNLTMLERLLTLQNFRGNPKAIEAVQSFRDASFSTAKGVVALVESAHRSSLPNPEPLHRTLNEIFVRDTARSLYELVGDLPKELYLRTEGQDHYFHTASFGLNLRALGGQELYNKLSSAMESFRTANEILARDGLSSNEKLARDIQRQQAMMAMGLALQDIGQKARQQVAEGASTAGAFAEFGMVAAEAMRGALGLEARGGRGTLQPSEADRDKRKKHGEVAARQIKERWDAERRRQAEHLGR